jgi:hypothetical protein
MVDFFETRSYWQGGFMEEQQKYYKEHRLSQKGKHLWEQINKLYIIAKTCALLIMLLIALINLVAVGGINTSLFNVSIKIMLPYLLMLREIMTFMMWNKLKNLLLGRVLSNLLICLKILMMHLINMRFMIYLNFDLIITRKKMAIFFNILIDALHQGKRLMPCRSLWKKKLLNLEAH